MLGNGLVCVSVAGNSAILGLSPERVRRCSVFESLGFLDESVGGVSDCLLLNSGEVGGIEVCCGSLADGL